MQGETMPNGANKGELEPNGGVLAPNGDNLMRN